MSKDTFYDLARKPTKLNDVDKVEKQTYPCVYDIGVDNYPPLKEMKLGSTGSAEIEFRIAKGGGIEVLRIKAAAAKTKEDTHDKKEDSESY